jgi:hypothetical protein
VGGMTLLLLLGLRAGWDVQVERSLRADIDSAHARGEVSTVNQANERLAAEGNGNAVASLSAAIGSLALSANDADFADRFFVERKFNETDQQTMLRIVNSHSPTLAKIRTLRELPRSSSVGLHFRGPYGGMYGLLDFMKLAPLARHIEGDDHETVELLLDSLELVDLLGHDSELDTNVTNTIEMIAPELRFEATYADSLPRRHVATREQVRQLIDALLAQEEPHRRESLRKMEMSRAMIWDACRDGQQSVTWPSPNPNWIDWAVRPAQTKDAIDLARRYTSAIAGLREPSYPKSVEILLPDTPPDLPPVIQQILDFTGRGHCGEPFSVLDEFYTNLTAHRVAAVRLAIRLYEVDHGCLPRTLDELAPDYLQRIPADPMARDGHPLRYRSTPGSEAIYSVGHDGVDNGGVSDAGGPAYPDIPPDDVFPLHPSYFPDNTFSGDEAN